MSSLDERLREGLFRSADRVAIDVEDAYARLQSEHRARNARARITRQAAAVAVVLTVFVGAAIVLSWHATPDRYRTTALVRVSGPAPASYESKMHVRLAEPAAVATSARGDAIAAARLTPDTVALRVMTRGTNQLELDVTAPSAAAATRLTRSWASVLARRRRDDARQRLRAAMRALVERVQELHRELLRVDAKLLKLDPVTYHGILRYDAPWSGLGQPPAPPPVPEQGTVEGLNLAYERITLLKELREAGRASASFRITRVLPDVSTRILRQTPARRVDSTPPATRPALAIWLVGLVLILAGAVVAYRVVLPRRRSEQAPPVR